MAPSPSAVVMSYDSTTNPIITIPGPNNINGLQASDPYIAAFKTFLLNERVRFVKFFDGKTIHNQIPTAASDYATIVGITPVINGGQITSWKLELMIISTRTILIFRTMM